MFRGTCSFHLPGGSEHSWDVGYLRTVKGSGQEERPIRALGWERDRAMPEPMSRTAQL
jgi:hypothetical protein